MEVAQSEIQAALKVVVSGIERCERVQPGIAEGSAQASLLRNRLRALRIAEQLLRGGARDFDRADLERALPPLRSIRSKTANARRKHAEGSAWYKRLTPTVDAMDVCEALVEEALAQMKA